MNANENRRLKVGIVCAPIHPDYGGPSAVVYSHYKALSKCADVKIFGVVEGNQREFVKRLYTDAILAKRKWPRIWFRGDGLLRMIEDAAPEIDIFHVHMLWDHSVYATWKASIKHSKPFIVTVHGTLSDTWRYSSPHKKIYKKLVVDHIINDAAAVHALNEAESISLRSIYPNCNILTIPNAVDCSEIAGVLSKRYDNELFPSLRGKRVFLYMGRIWGDKGLDILPEAWKIGSQSNNNSVLIIIGPDYNNYTEVLRQRIAALGLSGSVKILPSVHGPEKYRIMRAASVFLLPSKSEGFSMALLEASGVGLPSIYSRECNFPELAAVNGGIQINRTVEELAKAISRLNFVTNSFLMEMGLNARYLVRSKFDISVVGNDLLRGYKTILGNLDSAKDMH